MLHVVTPGPPTLEEPCDGTYVCQCKACRKEVAARMRAAASRKAA